MVPFPGDIACIVNLFTYPPGEGVVATARLSSIESALTTKTSFTVVVTDGVVFDNAIPCAVPNADTSIGVV